MEMKTTIELKINQVQNSNASTLELCNNLVTAFKE